MWARRWRATSRRAPAYLALKAKLAELRAGKGDAGMAPIPDGPALKVGGQDAACRNCASGSA